MTTIDPFAALRAYVVDVTTTDVAAHTGLEMVAAAERQRDATDKAHVELTRKLAEQAARVVELEDKLVATQRRLESMRQHVLDARLVLEDGLGRVE